MINYSASTTINKPVAEVFRFVADVSQYSKWMGIRDATVTSPGPFGAGSQILMTLKMGPLTFPTTFELSAYEPNKRLSFKTVSTGTVQWDSDLTFEALSDTSTRLSNSGEIGLRGIWRLFEPLMAGEVKSGEQKELEKVKQILQGS